MRVKPPALLKEGEIIEVCEEIRREGKSIVFTNGCFDILHPGHISTLEFAKKHGDVLIVGVNSDLSVKKIKGKGKPVMREDERVKMLLACRFVDYVVIFNEETPLRIIEMIKPHVIVKGGDWKGKKIAGEDVVKKYGGKIIFAPYLQGISTTEIIKRIKKLSLSLTL